MVPPQPLFSQQNEWCLNVHMLSERHISNCQYCSIFMTKELNLHICKYKYEYKSRFYFPFIHVCHLKNDYLSWYTKAVFETSVY